MNQSASVYFRRGVWIVGPLSPTATGPSVATSPYVQLPATITYPDLAREVRVALSRSKTIPDIDFRNQPMPPSPVLVAAGVKSWSTFHKGAKLVTVRVDDEQITLNPTINEGAREGFAWVEAKLHIPATATSEELGEALKQAFELCE